MLLLVPVLVGILLAQIYGVLLRASVERTFCVRQSNTYSPVTGAAGLLFITVVRLALFGFVAYLMLRWSMAHLILMAVSFFVTLWIIMFIVYRSDYPHVGR